MVATEGSIREDEPSVVD